MGWLKTIADGVGKVEGVTTSVREPQELSNHSPVLSIRWDPDKLGITGDEVAKILFTPEPRIVISPSGEERGRQQRCRERAGLSVTAYMMSAGEDKIVGDRLRQVLSQKRPPAQTRGETACREPAGRWDVHIEFASSASDTYFI